ncbi:Plant invertase/pectin methylesterase inhibitor superfamily protein [Euphorbia peplus]|nr:Plant invertase/pectin methylesterase inhibitor superfamily protein [Euphorbia peplus]
MKIFLCKILIFTVFLSWVKIAISSDSYVREACSVTRYQNLCIHSLASFSHTAKKSPSIWARAGVSVTIGEAKNVTHFLYKLKKHKAMKGKRNRIALLDCIECFGDSLDNLHRSLGVLRKLEASEFDVQMSDVTTWLSAALTDADTCLDGFEIDDKETYTNKQVRVVRIKVSRATYITSNALALVNKLASTGLGNSVH